LDLGGGRQRLLERATLALGQLSSVCVLLPDRQLFLYSYVRREAVLSSHIEGTQSSLNDLLLFEMEEVPGVPFDDVQEVSNYIGVWHCPPPGRVSALQSTFAGNAREIDVQGTGQHKARTRKML
jgi:hypothetical protein